MLIKEFNLHLFPELNYICNCSCGMTSDQNHPKFIGHEWNRWFKVNGVMNCFHCVYEIALDFKELELI